MKLTAISGLGVKGPACFLFEIKGKRFLLDLGRGPDGDALPDLSGLGSVDAVIFSHGHVDHTGGLSLHKALGMPKLFAPSPTIALSQDPLMKTATPYEGLENILGVAFVSGPSGHAPGASWIRLGGEEGLLYGGDASSESSLWKFTLPPKATVAIFDASYGDSDQTLVQQQALIANKADKPLLLPCPAGGRGLEMALDFLRLGHEVRLCESHHQVAQEMLNHPVWLAQKGLKELLGLPILRADSQASGIMIGAGPNAERGVAAHLAPRFIAEKSAEVIFTGHIALGTPAEAMTKSGRAHFMRWNVHPNLSGLRDLIKAANPHHILAAFCTKNQISRLEKALERPLIQEKVTLW